MLDDIVLHFKNDTLHHAYFIGNAGPDHRTFLLECITHARGVPVSTDPDVQIVAVPVFGINEAHALRDAYAQKSISGQRRFFVIESPVFTEEGQNALLKLLEDPTTDASVFVLGIGQVALSPTLSSRFYHISSGTSITETALDPAQFMAANAYERIQLLAPFIKKGANAEERPGKHRFAETFIAALILFAEERAARDRSAREALVALAHARGYTRDTGSVPSLLLEHLAVSLPRVS